jgi:hypothetical protein
VPALSTVLWVAGGVAIVVVVWKSGLAMLRGMGAPPPEPPPAGEMRRINVKYRCSVCGLELRMTLAPDEDPPPPRHCLEEMALLAPID